MASNNWNPNNDTNKRYYGCRDEVRGIPRWVLFFTIDDCFNNRGGKVSYVEPEYKVLTPPGVGPGYSERSMEQRAHEAVKRSLN